MEPRNHAYVEDIFSEWGQSLAENPTRALPFQEEFDTVGFVQLENVIAAGPLTELMRGVFDILSPLAHEAEGHHTVDGNSLGPGGHYRLLDPGHRKVPPQLQITIYEVLRDAGFVRLGAALGSTLTPLVQFIVREPVQYERIFFLFYEEGDYISPHNDAQTGDRINVQFPVPLDAVSVLRVLREGLFRVHYDTAGCMRILGPRVWHEVVPVLRSHSRAVPKRVNLTLRFR